MDGELSKTLAAAAAGRLDGVCHVFPDNKVLLYSHVRKEAVLSSQIQGTQSSLPYACERINLTFRTAAKAIEVLVALGIAEEVTGRARNRLFIYRKYVETLNRES